MPYTSATKLVLDSGEFEEVMDRCMATAEWASFKTRRRDSERNGRLRGIGMATYTERCGGGFPETASIEFKDDRVELVMGNQEYGTGLHTAYKQIVSDQLGIDADHIEVIMGDTDRTPSGLTGGSRAIAVGGAALYEAARIIACRRRRHSPMAVTSWKSRSTRIPARSLSRVIRSSTISAAPSIRCCWKGRCMAAWSKASARRSLNTRSTIRSQASSCRARSWTMPCRAPATFRISRLRPTMCRRRQIRSASKARARR